MDSVEVVLRDFDGSQTIYPTELPLREVIHTAMSDMDILVTRVYAKTELKDHHGRIIYVQQ